MDVQAHRRGMSWTRRVLVVLCAMHGALLLILAGPEPATRLVGFWPLLAMNALAIAGLLTRTRSGWFAVLLFVLAAAVRWTGSGIEETGGLLWILGVAIAVFCVTDPSLRREHGIAA